MALAFYIEYPRITVVEVSGNAKKPRIKRVIVGDLPEARNDDGTPVADKQAWFNTEITKFCKENKLSGKAYLLVGPDGMRYRDMQIAFTERSKIDRVLQYEVEALIPSTPIEELALGYEILHTDENGSKLLVQAAEREYIRERITALEEAGMSVKAADSHLSGTLNLGLLHLDLATGTPGTLWIDFAGTTATVSIVDDGHVLTSRVFMSPYLAGVTAQAGDIKDKARELEEEATAHAEAFHDDESENLPGTDSVSELPESESVNIGAEEVANRIDHMSQEQLAKFISRVAIEARRTMYSHNYGEDPQRLVVSGLGYAGDALANQLGEELALSDSRSIDLMETVNPRGKDAQPKVEVPDIGELSYLTGVAMKGVGRDISGIDFRTGSLAAGTTFDYARTPLAFTATLALLFGGIMFLISYVNVDRLNKDISRLVKKSAKNPDYETPKDLFDHAYVQDWKKESGDKKAAYEAFQEYKKTRTKKEKGDMTYRAMPDDPAQEIRNTYNKLDRQIKRLGGKPDNSDSSKKYPTPHPRDKILELVLNTIEKGGPSYDFALLKIDISERKLSVDMFVSANEPKKELKKYGNISEANRMIKAFKDMVKAQKLKVKAEKDKEKAKKLDWFESEVDPKRGNSSTGAEGRTVIKLTLSIDLVDDPKSKKTRNTRPTR